MQKTEMKNLFSAAADYMDSQVTVCGWVKTIRQSKTLAFIALNAGTCFKNLQVVLEEGKLPNYQEIVKQQIKGPKGELIRIEMFAHGALCMAVSGKCYLSL